MNYTAIVIIDTSSGWNLLGGDVSCVTDFCQNNNAISLLKRPYLQLVTS
jgi:hypothetical protein